ncbi:hypothetical protein [Rhizobium ecuadorense]|uniref:hypothetical protein n=1 Tax=Rhizobium ecuadorense TaxID=1671795 RepID=UPI001872921A|nr:hypothetical protein [Rhizobium ecuadorense]
MSRGKTEVRNWCWSMRAPALYKAPYRLPLWGDIVHVAAVQFADPTVTIGYDVDQAEAERENWRVFDDAARNRNMIGGAYLPFPGLGHVRDSGDKTCAYVPLN